MWGKFCLCILLLKEKFTKQAAFERIQTYIFLFLEPACSHYAIKESYKNSLVFTILFVRVIMGPKIQIIIDALRSDSGYA